MVIWPRPWPVFSYCRLFLFPSTVFLSSSRQWPPLSRPPTLPLPSCRKKLRRTCQFFRFAAEPPPIQGRWLFLRTSIGVFFCLFCIRSRPAPFPPFFPHLPVYPEQSFGHSSAARDPTPFFFFNKRPVPESLHVVFLKNTCYRFGGFLVLFLCRDL